MASLQLACVRAKTEEHRTASREVPKVATLKRLELLRLPRVSSQVRFEAREQVATEMLTCPLPLLTLSLTLASRIGPRAVGLCLVSLQIRLRGASRGARPLESDILSLSCAQLP